MIHILMIAQHQLHIMMKIIKYVYHVQNKIHILIYILIYVRVVVVLVMIKRIEDVILLEYK